MQTTTLVVRKLTLPFFIGVLEDEKRDRQNVTINVDMRVSVPDRPSEEAQNYVSYASVVEYLIGLSENGRHIDLIEELADDIFRVMFTDPRILGMRVEILKPDIFAEAESVGVVIERDNPSRRS